VTNYGKIYDYTRLAIELRKFLLHVGFEHCELKDYRVVLSTKHDLESSLGEDIKNVSSLGELVPF
jgi:hypothetical protein